MPAVVVVVVLGVLVWPFFLIDLLLPRTWGSRDSHADHPDRALGAIHLQVVGALREPLAGAPLSVHRTVLDDLRGMPPIATATTGSDGDASLGDLPRGELSYRVSKPGYTTYAWSAQLWLRHHLRDRERVVLFEARTVEGTVIDEHGDPIAGARVVGHSAIHSNRIRYESPSTVTAAQGRFVLEALPASEVYVAAYAPDHAETATGPHPLASGPIPVRMGRGPTAALVLSVKVPSGDAVADVCLELELTGDPLPRRFA